MENVLEEILIKPSQEIKTNRFDSEQQEAAFCKADCSGKCSSNIE